jgi:hypothetical protein
MPALSISAASDARDGELDFAWGRGFITTETQRAQSKGYEGFVLGSLCPVAAWLVTTQSRPNLPAVLKRGLTSGPNVVFSEYLW